MSNDKLFTQPNRFIVPPTMRQGVLSPLKLIDVAERLSQIEGKQDPKDYTQCLSELEVDFTTGVMRARWKWAQDQVFLLSTTGASQLAGEVLPPRFFSGLKKLIPIDRQGALLATQVWAKFASCESHTERLVRTANRQLVSPPGASARVIRSVHSKGYATYSNKEFVKDILDNAGEYSHMPVLDWTMMDDGMRIRFACLDQGKAAFMHFDPKVLLSEPIPMIEAWNSEVGRRRVGLRAGMWRLASATGFGHWSERTEYGWIHRGRSERIAGRVKVAIQDLHTVANEVCAAYSEARYIDVDNPYTWLEKELKDLVSEKVLRWALEGLKDPTVTPGNTLATVIDAVALAAHRESDIYDQYEIERVASKLLEKGRREARDGKLWTKKEAA